MARYNVHIGTKGKKVGGGMSWLQQVVHHRMEVSLLYPVFLTVWNSGGLELMARYNVHIGTKGKKVGGGMSWLQQVVHHRMEVSLLYPAFLTVWNSGGLELMTRYKMPIGMANIHSLSRTIR
jgi:hypothetical protein